MPVFRSDRARAVARNVRALLMPKENRGSAPGQEGPREPASVEDRLQQKRRELRGITTELRAAKKRGDRATRNEHLRLAKHKNREIFQLQMERRAAREEGWPEDGEVTGALPDFAVVGGAKCGTTFFYHLLTLHPLVEDSAMKEVHFFDRLFDEGVEWYRGCFPRPRSVDGRRTITGDGTPGYLFNPLVPERMAGVIPDARLVSVIRNPVDRAYSAYHHRVRNGNERRPFEEAVEHALEVERNRPPGESRLVQERESESAGRDIPHGFISNGVYVEHLMNWERFYPRERMFVVKSEEFFDDPAGALQPVLEYLGLPAWTPGPSELPEKRKNTGGYDERMDPGIRRSLEEFYEPHNRRLYDYLGRDLGW